MFVFQLCDRVYSTLILRWYNVNLFHIIVYSVHVLCIASYYAVLKCRVCAASVIFLGHRMRLVHCIAMYGFCCVIHIYIYIYRIYIYIEVRSYCSTIRYNWESVLYRIILAFYSIQHYIYIQYSLNLYHVLWHTIYCEYSFHWNPITLTYLLWTKTLQDTPNDVHSPKDGFWWSHAGWLLDQKAVHTSLCQNWINLGSMKNQRKKNRVNLKTWGGNLLMIKSN